MELCISRSISNLPNFLTPQATINLSSRTSLSQSSTGTLRHRHFNRLHSRFLFLTHSVPRASLSEEETSGGAPRSAAATEERDSSVAVEDSPSIANNVYVDTGATEVVKEESPSNEQAGATEVVKDESPSNEQANELLDSLNIKFDSEDTYSIILYGGGALIALWLTAAIVRAIDSIPLFPKLMEVVGLGYSFWFTTRYLLFKKNRAEFAAKVEELKQQVLGSDDE
ncbi:hypothetical protein K2173_014627 [Erythroxylum novogranatense]|uniref:Cyanobacterial aminoacyl-tRNA synthetase CAAD domain-containing protein n=1 Tax=Erythroxylum novogranatense TaxID=1862640 RepID=A0AAV8TF99_9ROSI|nr:hypothetical protein K2173_014627 [Erythroxylum novogranatense]